jgi:hypothetical protein
MTHHDDASTYADVLAHWGDDGTKELFRRLLEQALQDLIDADLTAQIGAAAGSWHGSGTVEPGLDGAVSAERLLRLFDGEHPATGNQPGHRLR